VTTATDNQTVIERYIASLSSGDVESVRDSFAVDASWQLRGDLPIGGTWNGRDAIIDEFLATARGYFEPDSISIEVTNIASAGDQVTLEWTSRAQTRRGRSYENHCIGVFTVRDGKIQAVREYMDTLYAREVAFAA
jgi:uncharacterized protein